MHNKIGYMLFNLREKAGISQKNLGRGVLSVTELSRVESGQRRIDRLHLEALFQRIGKSLDKLELAMSMEEYRLLELKHALLNQLIIGNTADTENMLKEYSSYIDMRKPLHSQAMLSLQAVRTYIEDKNDNEDAALFEKALGVTFPEWKEANYDNICLCTQEIQLILAILYIKLNAGIIRTGSFINLSEEEKETLEVLRKIYKYIDVRYTDDEERAKVYPQCAWLLSQVCLLNGKISMAYEICRKGVDCLAKNGVFTVMKELLEIKTECLERMAAEEELRMTRRHREAVEFIYNIADKPYMSEKIVMFFMASIQSEVVVTNELIREMRISQKMSQEELSADICTQETLSRIESGMRSPNAKKLYQMLKRLGLERERYYGFIIAEDYELYEKVRLYQRYIGKEERESAASILAELEEKLDYSYTINKQFIETDKIIAELNRKEISYECGYEKLKTVLRYSMKDYDDTIYRVPFRQEVVILNKMAGCLRQDKKEAEAMEIYRQILDRYNSSMVSKVFHSVPLMLIYINYTGLLEDTNHLSDAEEIGKEGIRIMLECQRGDVAAKILANLSCVYEKGNTNKDKELAKNSLRNSFYLLDLYLNDYNKAILKEAYERLYKDSID